MWSKAQSSVELTMVIGMALVLTAPFILASQTSMIQLREASQFMELDASLDRLKETSNLVQRKSYPARRTVDVNMPEDAQEAYNPKFEEGSALVFQMTSGGTEINHSIVLDFKLDVIQYENITEEGIHEVSIRKKKSEPGVNMKVIQ